MTRGSGRGSAIYVHVLIRAAERAGVDIHPLLDEVGIRLGGGSDEETWYAREQVYRLWGKLAARLDDPDLGLHIAEAEADQTSVGVLEYSARHAPMLGDAFSRVERYGRLVHDGADFRFVRKGDIGTLSYTLPDLPDGPNRQAAEWAAASWVLKGRAFTGQDFAPLRVRFRHRAPARITEHERIFRCPVDFGDELTEVTFTGDVLDLPVKGADRGLGQVLDTYAAELVERLPAHNTIEDRVRHYLIKALSTGGDPSLQAIAKALAMSARTLQRRLKDDGLTHRELVEEIRQSLAMKFVDDDSLSIGEIAFLLGFSEPSAFLRAFRRWTGTSPGRMRSGEGATL